MGENTHGDWAPSWRFRRLHPGLKDSIISYFECNRNIHNWFLAGSEPWVIAKFWIILNFSRFEPDDSYKNYSYKKKRVTNLSIRSYPTEEAGSTRSGLLGSFPSHSGKVQWVFFCLHCVECCGYWVHCVYCTLLYFTILYC